MSNNKFRSWDGGYKRFYYFENGIYYNSIECYEPGFSMCSFFDWDNAEQFTGLTDKNGKEIYEGDILIDPNFDEEITCEYDARIAGFIGWGDDRISGCYLVSEEGMEIIGNIHEATK